MIKSISDLVTNLKNDFNKYDGTLWFRGHSNETWKLLPHYLRLKKPPSEMTLLTKFKQNAIMLLNHKPTDNFDWLFLMQHYGVPTRLLDWSESSLVALYFCVNEIKDYKKNGALWILKPKELNLKANIDSKEKNYIPSFEEDYLKNYSVESLQQETSSKLLPMATIATRNNIRIQAQLGVFTISHRDRTSIEEIGDKNHIKKYIIPSGSKKNILHELKLLGITKFQIFPELSSIGEIITGDIK
jgi:hypothetical protein